MKSHASLSVVIAITLVGNLAARGAEVRNYPGPAGMKSATDRVVKVSGQPVFVYETAVNFNRKFSPKPVTELTPLCYFDFSGDVTVEVTPVGTKIDTVDIRPKSLGIVPKISPGKDAVTFTLSRPAKLSIEFNGNLHRTLHLFADAIDPNPPKPGDPSVRYFGPGIHTVGEVQIADRQTIYLAGGAYVNGQLIAAGKRGVRIAGRGILTGRAYDREKSGSHCNVELNNCTSPVVDGVICLDPPGWSFNVYHSAGVLIQDVKYIGARANSDGLSLQSCDGVTVRDCFVRGWDDNIVVKNYEGDTHRVRASDCTLWTDLAQSIEIGYETRGGVMDDIAFSNIQVIHNFHKPVLSIHNGDRAAIRNVRYENIIVEDAQMGQGDGVNHLIDLWIGRSPWTRDSQRGTIQGVSFKSVSVTGGNFPESRIWGADASHTVRGVSIENLTILGRKVLSLEDGKFATNPFIEPPSFK